MIPASFIENSSEKNQFCASKIIKNTSINDSPRSTKNTQLALNRDERFPIFPINREFTIHHINST